MLGEPGCCPPPGVVGKEFRGQMLQPSSLRGNERAVATALALALCVTALAAAMVLAFGATGERIATLAAIYITCAVGLMTFSGNTGIVSFGHAGFVGIGAYAAAILTMPAAMQATVLPLLPRPLAGWELPLWGGLIAAALAGGGLGLLTGLPVARLRGSAASIASLGLLIIIYTVLSGARDFTRGNQTFYGVPRATTLPMALLLAVLAITAAALFKHSRAGLFARAQRDNEPAAVSVGIAPARARLAAWVLSAVICATGGALLAHYLGAFSPRTFYFDLTFMLVAMMIFGGMTSVSGAVAGVIGITALLEVLRKFETGLSIGGFTTPPVLGIASLGLGFGILIMLMARPRGLTNGREAMLPLPDAVRRAARPAPDAPPAAPVSLTVRDMSKRFAGVDAVTGVTCEIGGGRVTGLIGPNGAGKTTFVNLITGHIEPTAGSVHLGATAITALPPVAIARHGVARTFQNIRVFESLTVLENVVVAALAQGATRRDAEAIALAELDRLDLAELADMAAGALSYGPRRRLEIARALAMRPRVLMLDEPAAGMNPAETDDLKARLSALAATRGIAVLLIDHDLPFVMGLSSHVLVLDRGRIIATGTPGAVQADPRVIEAYIGAPADPPTPRAVAPPRSGQTAAAPA